MIKTKYIQLAALTVASLVSANVMAQDSNSSCNAKAMEQVSIYYAKSIELDGDPGKIYEQAVQEINDIALKHELKEYKMTSDGISISTSSYNGMLDISVNISIEYLSDYSAITALTRGTKANSISSQRYFEPCE